MTYIGSTTTNSGAVSLATNEQPSRLDTIINSMKKEGFSDDDIKYVKQAVNDPKSLPPEYFSTIDKVSLNALQYSGQSSESIKNLLHVPVSMSLIRTIGNPENWKDGQYIGFGRQVVEDFLAQDRNTLGEESIDSIVLATLIIRAKLLQKQVESKINDIKAINKEIEEVNEMVTRATSLKKIANDKDSSRMPQDMIDFWNKYGAQIHGTDDVHEPEGWDVNIRSLKNVADKLTSDSQIATTELQQTINKYNQAFELATSFMKKYESTATTVAKG